MVFLLQYLIYGTFVETDAFTEQLKCDDDSPINASLGKAPLSWNRLTPLKTILHELRFAALWFF